MAFFTIYTFKKNAQHRSECSDGDFVMKCSDTEFVIIAQKKLF